MIIVGFSAFLILGSSLLLRNANSKNAAGRNYDKTHYRITTDGTVVLASFFDGLSVPDPRFVQGRNPYLRTGPTYRERFFKSSLFQLLGLSPLPVYAQSCGACWNTTELDACGYGCGAGFNNIVSSGDPKSGANNIGYACEGPDGCYGQPTYDTCSCP